MKTAGVQLLSIVQQEGKVPFTPVIALILTPFFLILAGKGMVAIRAIARYDWASLRA